MYSTHLEKAKPTVSHCLFSEVSIIDLPKSPDAPVTSTLGLNCISSILLKPEEQFSELVSKNINILNRFKGARKQYKLHKQEIK